MFDNYITRSLKENKNSMILHHLKFIDKIITIIAFLEMRIRCEKSQGLNLFKILFAKILGMKQIF